MLPSERARITRRRRLAHLGVGGVIIAAASVRIATAEPAPAPEPAVTAAHTVSLQEVRRVHARANRSMLRHRIHSARLRHLEHLKHLRDLERQREARVAARAVPASTAGIGWPWPQLAGCESGGHWSEVTGNGFLWGLQFVASTWDSNRGSLPTAESYLARGAAPTPAEQVEVGRRIQAGAGWGAWPVCSAELGLR